MDVPGRVHADTGKTRYKDNVENKQLWSDIAINNYRQFGWWAGRNGRLKSCVISKVNDVCFITTATRN